MPVYTYKCELGCDTVFDLELTIAELGTTIAACPECGELGVKRVYYAPGIAFKGSGWACKDG